MRNNINGRKNDHSKLPVQVVNVGIAVGVILGIVFGLLMMFMIR